MKGEKLKGALAKAPREKAMERLSPGVYRGSKGGLVSQGGQAIRRQPQQQIPQDVAGAASGIAAEAMRQPGPLPTQASPEQIAQMIVGQPIQQMYQPVQGFQNAPGYMPQQQPRTAQEYRQAIPFIKRG